MRIAIFTDTYIPEKNGVSASVDHFTRMMAAEGHQIMIFCPKYGLYKDKKISNISVRRYSSITAPSYSAMQLALPFIVTAVKDLKAFGPDVVHIQTPVGVGWIGIWATKILKLKNIQTYHTYIPDFLVYAQPKMLFGSKKKKIDDRKAIEKIADRLERIEDLDERTALLKIKNYFDKITEQSEKREEKRKKKGQKRNETLGRDYTRLVYNRADLVLTPSVAMAKVLKKQGINTKVEVQSNGIDYDYFKKKTDYKITNRIIYFGRLGHEKNVDVVVRSFNIAQKTIPELRLDIYGDGPAKKALQSLTYSLGLSNKVKFYGTYDIAKLSSQFCNYDYFVTASTIETQGIVILEAMSSGLPVLGVNKLAVPEVVKNGVNGYISKAFDIEDMAKNMIKMTESEKKLKQFGQNSLKIAKTHEITKCKNQLLAVYERVASGKI